MSHDPAALLSLAGKTALVTGGSRGIGRAISLALAEAGAFVAINYRSGEEAANTTLDELKSSGGAGMLAPFDVAGSDLVDQGVNTVLEEKGSIEILVNNAGVTIDGLLGRMKDSDWADVVQTDLTSAFYLCRRVGKSMIRNRTGRIINIASTAGEAGNPGQTNYSAAKAGLIGFTKALARELAPRNVLVNAVSPGIISGGRYFYGAYATRHGTICYGRYDCATDTCSPRWSEFSGNPVYTHQFNEGRDDVQGNNVSRSRYLRDRLYRLGVDHERRRQGRTGPIRYDRD